MALFPWNSFLCLATLVYLVNGNEIRGNVGMMTRSGAMAGFRQYVLDRYVDIFLGIPYAKPPTEQRRFRAPEPAEPWPGTLNATTLPPSCYQQIDNSFDQFLGVDMWNPNTAMSEDCLYLNVWAPRGEEEMEEARAVMVWIYGGAFDSGTSTLPLYDGKYLAAEGDVIVVSMQYRLGVLGFLYSGDIHAPGNMGLLDQTLAIKWVHDNIEAFGGDPDRITLFGESAGAGCASLHLLSPLSQPLIKSSIMQSGSAMSSWALTSRQTAVSRGYALAGQLGCDGTNSEMWECLENKSAEDIVAKQRDLPQDLSSLTPWCPVIDGTFLTQNPRDVIVSGAAKATSILLGVNENEGNYFMAYLLPDLFDFSDRPSPISKEQYNQAISAVFDDLNPGVRKLIALEYGEAQSFGQRAPPYRDALDDAYGDAHFKCPVLAFAELYAHTSQNVYLYNFAHRSSASPWPSWMGAIHGYEIDHVFGLPLNESSNYERSEQQLSRLMIKYWANFAKSGNPNTNEENRVTARVVWPAYSVDSPFYLNLNAHPEANVESGLRSRQCQLWNDVIPEMRAYCSGLPSAGSVVTCGASALLDHNFTAVAMISLLLLPYLFCN